MHTAAYEWSVDKRKCKRTVAHSRCVCDEDIADQIQGIVPDPIQNVTSGVTSGPVKGCRDDDTDKVDAEEE